MNADTASQMAFNLGSVTNSGMMEATSTGGLVFRVATTNAKTIAAPGANITATAGGWRERPETRGI